jgi:hypothetical protein
MGNAIPLSVGRQYLLATIIYTNILSDRVKKDVVPLALYFCQTVRKS